MKHIITVTYDAKSNLKTLIRQTVNSFLSSKKTIELSNTENILLEIEIICADLILICSICNEIYSLKSWIDEKYNKKISVVFVDKTNKLAAQ